MQINLRAGFFYKGGMMESYEIEPDNIINWAVEYASYEDLEAVAKSLYSIYIMRRKKENPPAQKAAKVMKKQFRKNGWRK